jgi:adenine/guanine/hypoxanthine permease
MNFEVTCKRMLTALERYFEFALHQTNWRTEILAGCTTFLTMAYIIFVNPSILATTGMPVEAVTAATCLAAGLASILMGAWARYPIALAPGMGLNAYFAFTVVKGMGVPWQTALGAVFLSGVAFLVLTLLGIRRLILEAIPTSLYSAVAAGIGLFIAFIGLQNAGILAPSPATLVTLGNLHDPKPLLALATLLAMAILQVWRVRAAILLGILGASALAIVTGLHAWQPGTFSPAVLSATAFQLDIPGALRLGALEILFVFLFVDLFDNLGTLIGVGTRAGLFERDSPGSPPRIPRIQRVLTTDSIATMAGALAGTSTVVSYIESAAGVVAGGRTGIVAITSGLLFLLALPLVPLAGALPIAATSPALVLVGSLMATQAKEIDWDDPVVALPAFLTLILIPLTFSIANGLAFGFTAYTLLRAARGQWREIPWVLWILTALFVLRFAYLQAG